MEETEFTGKTAFDSCSVQCTAAMVVASTGLTALNDRVISPIQQKTQHSISNRVHHTMVLLPMSDVALVSNPAAQVTSESCLLLFS